MNLDRHISDLLNFHECVIIPEFGGFISNYKPAEFDASNNTLLPPSKEVIFNAQIKKNDGLLINQISEKENITYREAECTVMNLVDRIFETLNKGESFEMNGLGTFEISKNGTVLFQSTNDFQLLDAYGLQEISYPTIHIHEPVFNTNPSITRVLNNKKDLVRIAASVAIVVALSVLPSGIKKTPLQSSVINTSEFTQPSTTVLVEEKIEQTPVEEIAPLESETIQGNYEAPTLVVETESPFILIGGSFKSLNNAAKYHHSLKIEGFKPEIMELSNGWYRVVIDSYNTRYDAETAMIKYRSKNHESKAWVGTR